MQKCSVSPFELRVNTALEKVTALPAEALNSIFGEALAIWWTKNVSGPPESAWYVTKFSAYNTPKLIAWRQVDF